MDHEIKGIQRLAGNALEGTRQVVLIFHKELNDVFMSYTKKLLSETLVFFIGFSLILLLYGLFLCLVSSDHIKKFVSFTLKRV